MLVMIIKIPLHVLTLNPFLHYNITCQGSVHTLLKHVIRPKTVQNKTSGVAEMKLMPGPTWAWLIILGVASQ